MVVAIVIVAIAFESRCGCASATVLLDSLRAREDAREAQDGVLKDSETAQTTTVEKGRASTVLVACGFAAASHPTARKCVTSLQTTCSVCLLRHLLEQQQHT